MNRETVEAMVLEGQAEVLEAMATELEKVYVRLAGPNVDTSKSFPFRDSVPRLRERAAKMRAAAWSAKARTP